MKTTLPHPILGEITLSCSARARRISLSVRPPQGAVRLTYPPGISQKKALEFLESKTDWTLAAQKRVTERFATEPVGMPFSTRRHTLTLQPAATNRVSAKVADGKIVVRYPAERNYTEPEVQECIKAAVERAWRIEAQEYLPGRVEALAREHGFRYRAVAIRNTRSKWGSCSPRGDLSLSLHLMKMPDEMVDYIILHELCHTVHHNHGPRFHALLEKVTRGAHAAMRREVKTYNTRW